MTALVVLVSVVFVEPVLFVVAIPLAAATYAFWYQSSGVLRERLRRTRTATDRGGRGGERRGGFGPGPREGFESARGQRARTEWERRQRQRRGGRRAGEGSGPAGSPGMSSAEAYRRLGLDRGADESEVQRAYRQKVKEVHPDRGGDEEEFKAVTEAYERLTR
jgi:DnaJ-domain-containing protein 1